MTAKHLLPQSLSTLSQVIPGVFLAGVAIHLFWIPPVSGQTFHQHTVTTSAPTVQAASGADIDGDGDVDVIAAAFGADELVWYENREGSEFTEHVISSSVDAPYCIHVADVNGDGYPDVFVGTLHGNNIRWFRNDPNGGFTSTTISNSAGKPYSLDVTTVDGDEHPDLVSAANGTDQIVWYRNEGGDTFSSPEVLDSNANGARSVFSADIDGNDRTDILAASGDEDTVSWLRNDPSSFREIVISQDIGTTGSVYAADVTGDGATDVLSGGVGSNDVILHENTTAGGDSVTFRTRVLSSTADGVESVVAADMGEDGHTDILSASRTDDTVSLYQNEGEARFVERIVTDSAGGAIDVSVADMEGDGDADVLVASQGDDSVRWFETNLHPLARDTSVSVREDDVLRLSAPGVLGNDEDPDGDSLTAEIITSSQSDSISTFESDGGLTVKANGQFEALSLGQSKKLSFDYMAIDEHGLADTATVQVTVRGENDAPTAKPDVDSTIMGARVATEVLSNDEDIDGELDPSSLSLSELPSHGSVRSDGVDGIVYTPESGFAGSDRYAYVVSDGHGATDTSRVDIQVRPNAPDVTRAEGRNGGVYLKWRRNDSLDVQEYRVYRTKLSDRDRGTPDTVIANSSVTEYEERNLINGRIYDYLVTAVVSGPVEGVPDTVQLVPRTPSVELQGAVSFGSPKQTSGYRMVGMPGAPENLSLAATLSGDAGEEWSAFAASGITESDGMVRYQEKSEEFTFDRGRGFWVLSESRWKPTADVARTPLDDRATTAFPMPEGWTIITNPFPESVSWSRVKEATKHFKSELWTFDGQFSTANVLEPYEGYYVFNDPQRPVDTLRIPYPIQRDSTTGDSSTAAGRKGSDVTVVGDDDGGVNPGLEIRARVVGEASGPTDSEGRVNVRVGSGTSIGRDSVDQFVPPSIGEKGLRLTIRSETASEVYPVLRSEGRPLGPDQVATFRIRLSGPSGEKLAVYGSGISGLAGASVFMYDPATEEVTNLRGEEAVVHLPRGRRSVSVARSFEVWVGDSKALNERRVAKAPSKLALSPPAPNPTSSSTRLRYSIPESQAPIRTEIVIYDVLGRTVQRLVSDRKEAGHHVIRWNGEDTAGQALASGVYFCRFIADGEPVETRKITVVR